MRVCFEILDVSMEKRSTCKSPLHLDSLIDLSFTQDRANDSLHTEWEWFKLDKAGTEAEMVCIPSWTAAISQEQWSNSQGKLSLHNTGQPRHKNNLQVEWTLETLDLGIYADDTWQALL